MKTQIAKLAAAAVVLGLAATPIVASAKTAYHYHALHHRVMRQNARIHEGLVTGKLDKAQAHSLYARDRRIQQSTVRDRRHDAGRLTPAEHARLAARLNATSRVIEHKKH